MVRFVFREYSSGVLSLNCCKEVIWLDLPVSVDGAFGGPFFSVLQVSV